MAERFLAEALEYEEKAKNAFLMGDFGYGALCMNLSRQAFDDALQAEVKECDDEA